MEGVASAVSRVAEIHQRIMPPRPSGDFAAHLDREIEKATPLRDDTQSHSLHAHDDGHSSGGKVLTPQLESFLRVHGIREQNGRLGDSGLMVPVSGSWHGNGKLLAPAAESWEQMRAAAAANGVDLRAIDTYRSYDVQASAYQDHLSGKKKANVLPPGRSEHGNGLAVDVTNGALVGPGDVEWDWLNANASRFGWHPISNESWHWEFRGRP